jgi:response regulator RpfG family c-di-GMP phosphodiesterase
MSDKVLFVDDDPNVLASYKRTFRKRFRVDTAGGVEEALGLLGLPEPYAVVVSDLRMPGLDGIRFLTEAQRVAPDTVRIMLTGHSDLETAIAAINEGRIFRFLTKPCAPEAMVAALAAGVAQFHLVTTERELLQKTLNGSIKVLTDVIALVNPAAFGRAARVRALTRDLCQRLTGQTDWQIQLAAMLSQLGCVGLGEDTLTKVYRGATLSAPEQAAFLEHPRVGAELLANIPRLDGVAAIIRYQEKRFDGGGVPQDGVHGAELPLGARILKLALDFDSLVAAGAGSAKACAELRQRHGWYDPAVLDALTQILKDEIDQDVQYVPVARLGPDMVLAQDVYSTTGILLVPQGQEITPLVRLRLANIAAKGGLVDPLRVIVRREAPATSPASA